jgi:hypothetical protein
MGHTDIKTTMVDLRASPDRMAGPVQNLQLDGSVSEKAVNIST